MRYLNLGLRLTNLPIINSGGGVGSTTTTTTPPPPTTTPPPPPSYGTFLYGYCSNYDLINFYADGTGGSYTDTVYNSPDCGYVPPTTPPPSTTPPPGYNIW